MNSIYFLLLLILAACGLKHSSVDYGKTTVSDLVAARGAPLTEKKIPTQDGKIFKYAENEIFQIKNDIVTHGFRDPLGDEKLLIFWKHKFKDCDTLIRKISQRSGHIAPEFEMKCSELGTTIVYSEESEYISRIIEHEKK